MFLHGKEKGVIGTDAQGFRSTTNMLVELCMPTEEYTLFVFTSLCMSEILLEKLKIFERIKQKSINIE